MTGKDEKRTRFNAAPFVFLAFVIGLAVAAWVVVLNPGKIAENLPDKGHQTISPQ